MDKSGPFFFRCVASTNMIKVDAFHDAESIRKQAAFDEVSNEEFDMWSAKREEAINAAAAAQE